MNKVVLMLLALTSVSTFAQDKKREPVKDELIGITDQQENSDKVPDQVLSELTFNEWLKEKYGLTPEQIKRYKQKDKAFRKKFTLTDMPKARNKIVPVKTAPGSKFVELKVVKGLPTYYTFVDVTGAEWPILDFGGGDDSLVKFTKVEHEPFNKIKVESQSDIGLTTLNLILEGLPVPLTIYVSNSETEYDSNPILQLDTVGPKGTVPEDFDVLPLETDDEMGRVLVNLEPMSGSIKLKSSDPRIEAWLSRTDELFIRTRLDMQFPTPRGRRYGLNGFKAYRSQYKPTIILFNTHGGEIKVDLERDESVQKYFVKYSDTEG